MFKKPLFNEKQTQEIIKQFRIALLRELIPGGKVKNNLYAVSKVPFLVHSPFSFDLKGNYWQDAITNKSGLGIVELLRQHDVDLYEALERLQGIFYQSIMDTQPKRSLDDEIPF